MAQIIKHRRGTISQLESYGALQKGEIGVTTGSIAGITTPVVHIGGGAVNYTVGRLLTGTSVPDVGSTANYNGMLFHDTDDYILYKLHASDNVNLDLTGNIKNRTIDGTLNITGIVSASSDLWVGGDVHAVGNITFKAGSSGTITLGDTSGDNIIFGADISSSIIPNNDDEFDLGSSGQQWKDLYVDGVAYIDTIGSDGDPTGTAYIAGGEIDGTVIGSESPAAGDFSAIGAASAGTIVGTTIDATTDFTIDGLVITADNITNDAALEIQTAAGDIVLDPGGNNVLPGSDNADDLGAPGTQWKDLYVHGIGYIDQLGTDDDAVAAYISSGELDGVTIGGESAAAITGTTIDATTDFTVGGTVITDNTITDDGTLVIASTTATSFSDGNITNVGDINVDSLSVDDAAVGLDIQFGGNTTLNKITLTDNLADALNINEGGNSYIKFITTNGSEQIVFGKNSTFNGTTIADLGTVTTANIDGGTVDGTTIGASSHTTIKGTTIDATTDFTVGSTVITDDSIVMTPSTSDTVTIAGATHGILNITTVDAVGTAGDINVTADGQIEFRANDAAGHIFDIAGTNQISIIDGGIIPTSNNDIDLGSDDNEFKDIWIDGTANIDTLSADTAAIGDLTSGRVVIAGTSGELQDDGDLTFSGDTLTATKIGAFQAAGAINFDNQNMTNVDINSGDIGAVTISAGLTWNAAQDLNSQNLTNVDINSGTVDGATIGASSHTTIKGTTIDATTDFTVGSTVITDDSIVMTPTAGDTTTFAASTNGALAITTVDTAAAAANITITADGTFEAIGTTVTLDSGGAINLEPADGSAILLDGTISIDAGVVTGATSITSTAFVGTLDGVIGGNTPAAITGTTITANTGIVPDSNDGAYLGQAGTAFSDLFLAEGGVINWDSGDATLTQASNVVTLAGATLTATLTNGLSKTANGGIGMTTYNGSAAVADLALDIDGMTDIGAAIASGDLIIVDDGAGGTNRKSTIDRVATKFAGTGLTATSAVIAIDAADTTTTSIINASLTKIGTATNQEYITFGSANQVNTFIDNSEVLSVTSAGIEVTGNTIISGNLTVNGTQTTISSSIVDIGDNIIQVNGTPVTYGGIHVKDVNAGQTGSMVWNSTSDYWVAGLSGSEYRVPIQDTTSALTDNRVVLAQGNGRIESSANITDDGSTVDFNDVDLTSLVKLEGVDTNTYIDIGDSGLIVTKGTIQPYTTGGNDLGATNTRYANLWLSGNADLEGDIDVNGTANLDNTDIDGTLDVAGVADFQARVDAWASLQVTGSVYVSAGASVAAASASLVSFRNDSNTQLGYLASADTQAVLAGVVGYNASTGKLTISSTIDGGTF